MIRLKPGFTLVELLIVITLIGILSTVALLKYGNLGEGARRAEALTVLSEVITNEKSYALENTAGTYTNSFANLDNFSATPVSQNFTFSLANATNGYVEAVRTGADSGRMSYGMCIESKKSASCSSSGGCNPGCP